MLYGFPTNQPARRYVESIDRVKLRKLRGTGQCQGFCAQCGVERGIASRPGVFNMSPDLHVRDLSDAEGILTDLVTSEESQEAT